MDAYDTGWWVEQADASEVFRSFWKEVALPSPGSRPPLGQDEVECIMRNRVAVWDGTLGRSGQVVLQEGVAILTSHRVIWYHSQASKAVHGHLQDIVNARISRNFFKSSTRVHVFVKGQSDERGDRAAIKLDFREGGRDEFLEQLRYLLQRKEWTKASGAAVLNGPQGGGVPGSGEGLFAVSKAGIGGIMRQQERARLQQEKLATEAFADLQSLMAKAKEVVAVTERYATVLAQKREAAAEGGSADCSEGEEAKETAELEGLLLNIGISNPVTRFSAGSLYHQELARQLADFLRLNNSLKLQGGMMTLPDVFCLFNRARGTELISPEDLIDSTKLLSALGLGMRCRTFKSGVVVIEADDFSDEQVSARIRELADQQTRLTSLDVVSHLKISLTLAQEFLLTAESRGDLCRDESVEGTLFYPNRFPNFLSAIGV